jgi:hypothetical protein
VGWILIFMKDLPLQFWKINWNYLGSNSNHKFTQESSSRSGSLKCLFSSSDQVKIKISLVWIQFLLTGTGTGD